MENTILYLVCAISAFISGYFVAKSKYKRELNHQKALNAVLRFRLKDRQQPTLEELKEINVWSGKAVNNVYKESIPKDCPEYAKQVREANISVMSPIVDNTTEPPKGSVYIIDEVSELTEDQVLAVKKRVVNKHDYKPHDHQVVQEFDRCTKCGEIN